MLSADSEEIVRATELQSNYANILDRAADHPISVPRGGSKEDITLVSRSKWQNALRSRAYQSVVVQLASVLASKLAGDADRPFPSELAWLSAFDDGDVAEFVSELAATMGAVLDDVKEPSAVAALLYEWHRSAIALEDQQLQARMTEVRQALA